MSGPALPLPPDRLVRLLAGFLREEAAKAGFGRFVVGVSGGVDSALALLLAVRAVEPSRVLALLMPYRTSSPESVRHAEEVVGIAGCRAETLDITPMVDAFASVADCHDPLRLGNKMARERMTLLYDRAMRDGALVVGTSNKTELLLGYSTRWGDGAHDLNPLGDLYKGQVRALAAHLGCPRPILDKPPSADLVPGQTDEQDLGLTYEDADRILHYLVDLRGRPEHAAEALGVDRETVRRVVRRVVRSQFKRMPPIICKVQARTIGIDFRFPRDWGV
ncbi:MAG: NAD+ synthase [Acidobacteria bacterium]|nr:MAG: NAD+ synthase [Acidobacteriota bacterium]